MTPSFTCYTAHVGLTLGKVDACAEWDIKTYLKLILSSQIDSILAKELYILNASDDAQLLCWWRLVRFRPLRLNIALSKLSRGA